MIGRLGNQTKLLEKALDATWLRNDVISNNIANVNTPGFKKSYVKFEELLQSQMNSSEDFNGRTFDDIPSPVVVKNNNTSIRHDGNNVDIDIEMAELAKNTIKYNALISQLTKEFSKIKYVINEGRR